MSLMTRRRMMGIRDGGGSLPPEYQQVEWIQTNNYCRIDSGVAFDGTKDFCLEAVALVVDARGTPYMGWNAGGIFGCSVVGGYWYDGAQTSVLLVRGDQKTKVEQIIYAGASSSTVTKYTSVENPANTQTLTREHANVSNRLALTNYPLFAVSKAPPNWDYSISMRLYEIKLGFNGVFETHLIPCYRKSDNVIGMYDIIKKSFRPNLGTGTFTKGADV